MLRTTLSARRTREVDFAEALSAPVHDVAFLRARQ
jgi:hypothetical protein